MENASCKRIYRRNPLETAFTDPSKMVYPPGSNLERDSKERTPKVPSEYELPPRPNLDYEVGMVKSESQ